MAFQTDATQEPTFPFSAIVGQDAMKRALLLNTINPKIGGVLIRGKKGTAKSTAVRSLAALLPEIEVISGCQYRCKPGTPQAVCDTCNSKMGAPELRQVRVVDLPVGATEDRLVGSIDIETAIKSGTKAFEPGLIAAAHRGILYIDEVNLLNDHLVDVLLDAAAMGRNYVEREGISISHSADFILIGTMNPEEGDLRPQLIDRFGLAVEVSGELTGDERQEVVRRRIAYENDPLGFMAEWDNYNRLQREKLLKSQELLPEVSLSADMLRLITDICSEYEVDGLRGDIVMYKTAITIAAYEGRTEVNTEDVREAAQMALLHRQRRLPFQQAQMVTDQLEAIIEDHQTQRRDSGDGNSESGSDDQGDSSDPDPSSEPPPDSDPNSQASENTEGKEDERFEIGESPEVPTLKVNLPDRRPRQSSGRRANAVSNTTIGRYVGSRIPIGRTSDMSLDATLRAAAPHQTKRTSNQDEAPAILIEPWDIREKVRETRTGSLILFIVDASGSMGAQRRMVAVKGAIMSLLLDAYQRRDKVALISFRKTSAELLLPPTNSVELAQYYLQEMPTGGRTPLSKALHLALGVLDIETMKDQDIVPLVVLLSDGRANVDLAPDVKGQEDTSPITSVFKEKHISSVVIDTETGFLKLQMAKTIADGMGAQYIRLDDIGSSAIADTVRSYIPDQSPFIHPEDIQTLFNQIKDEHPK